MRKAIWPVFSLLLLLSGCAKDNEVKILPTADILPSPQVSQETSDAVASELFGFEKASVERIQKDLLEIAKVWRPAGSEEERNAALYIMQQLKDAGYTPVMEEYYFARIERRDESGAVHYIYTRVSPDEPYDIKTQNVYAVRTAGNANEAPIIILSAHYDSFMGFGAFDNASGTAALLEIARLVDTNGGYEIRFVFFGAEEWFLRGSQNYVNDLTGEEKSRIIANINIDTIGYNGPSKLHLYIWDKTGTKAAELIKSSKEWYDIEVIESKDYKSDHTSFAEAGIPSALVIDKPVDINLSQIVNNEKDVLDNVDAYRIKSIVDMVLASLSEHIH